jgi:hypothetical protein
MQALLAAGMMVIAVAGGKPVALVAPEFGEARVHRVQLTLSWSGSWIWTPENRKWLDRDNSSSIRLLQGQNVEYCLYASCWNAPYEQKGDIYSFFVRVGSTDSYYEFWLGDFNSLEGRVWLDSSNRNSAPDGMVRMTTD